MLCHRFLDIKKTQEAGASIRVRTFLMKAVFYELPIFQTLRRACKPNLDRKILPPTLISSCVGCGTASIRHMIFMKPP